MAWCNTYTPPSLPQLNDEELYGPEPYDINFCFPIDLDTLENDRIKLTPYIPRIHAQAFFDVVDANPALLSCLPLPQWETIRDPLVLFEAKFRRVPGWVLFVIIDKTRPSDKPEYEGGSFAGVIGLIETSPLNLVTEIGAVIIFPDFQRTHVLSNATGLLLHYCLNLPTDSPSGLGLRRVEWYANVRNTRSIAAAERVGFKREGTNRWNWALPEGKEGNTPRPGDVYPEKLGRDTAVLSLCWDDWESGAREKVERVMARTS